ncbi:energy transducer TonB [Mucilaginibacter agri]|uniref:TonB family protein n=1 Tax=Mucilaginibacter agri TaxID=2695265 RepID=A0A965ZGB2_9SPHI|nr:energy transducer TonB [Mucilaginibacter agri]NCD69226.1 TonB family protein [Mucilaginibacter agri]
MLSVKSYAQPSFKGGTEAFNQFLTNNIVYPEYSRQNCIPATIKVSFKIDSAGNVNNATVVDGPGIDLDDEAIRVVKLTSGKWTLPLGYNPTTSVIIPIRFVPDNTRCINVTEASITLAINNYKAQQELQNAVTNYYKNKQAGKADPAKEGQILVLKKQLGYDDDFISDMLEQAGQKLKQGDQSGACEDWNFIRNIGSSRADSFIFKYCGGN